MEDVLPFPNWTYHHLESFWLQCSIVWKFKQTWLQIQRQTTFLIEFHKAIFNFDYFIRNNTFLIWINVATITINGVLSAFETTRNSNAAHIYNSKLVNFYYKNTSHIPRPCCLLITQKVAARTKIHCLCVRDDYYTVMALRPESPASVNF